MNYCEHEQDHKDCKGGKVKRHMPHWLHMVLCCGIPVILLLLLPYIGRLMPGSSKILALVIPFICPVMMGFMMFSMIRTKRMIKRRVDLSDSQDQTNQQA